jgi:hypothetical protein
LLRRAHGKEGVSGSSPEEGSAKAQQISAFDFGLTCTSSSLHRVWSRLWSFQVENAVPSSRVSDREARPRHSNDEVQVLKPRPRRPSWLGVRVKQRVEPSLDRLLLDLRTSRSDRRSERLERRGAVETRPSDLLLGYR